MKKEKFSGIFALIVLGLFQKIFFVFVAVKTVIQLFGILLIPHLRRDDFLSKFCKTLAVMLIFFFGVHFYNKLIDKEHFLHVAHGRLLVEMQRKQDLIARCRSAVSRYSALEEKIQDHLISLHQLTKTHGRQARIVQNEGLEIVKLVNELDLLIEKYPDLKSKGPYVLLMETLQEAGLRVINERINYNKLTYEYNVMRLLFPYKIVAWMCGFGEEPFLQGPLDYRALKEV